MHCPGDRNFLSFLCGQLGFPLLLCPFSRGKYDPWNKRHFLEPESGLCIVLFYAISRPLLKTDSKDSQEKFWAPSSWIASILVTLELEKFKCNRNRFLHKTRQMVSHVWGSTEGWC